MGTAVNTTIRNLTKGTFRCRWLVKGIKDIAPGQAVDVPYEPWSLADEGQRKSMLADLKSKKVAFTLTLVTPDGNFTQVQYDPSALVPTQARSASPARKAPAPSMGTRKAEETDHVVIAGSGNVDGLGLGLKATVPKPKESLRLNDAPTNELGFSVTNVDPVEHSVVAGGEDAGKIGTDGIEEQYNELAADKKWTEALALLKERFGDKVTFGVRAVMTNKNYKTIVEKYNLE